MSLYQHQRDGAAWLAARTRAYLGDVPGLGKTRTLLAATGADRPLIICPAIVRTHWRREETALFGTCDTLHVKSYDEIVRGGYPLMAELIPRVDTLILDEAHLLKHASSRRTKLILGRDGYARRLPRVYAASGTPVPKNPAELWTVLSSLFPDVAREHRLRTYADFVERFCTTRTVFVRGRMDTRILPLIRNEAEFRELLAKVMLVRTLDDVGLDVPVLDWQTMRLDASAIPFDGDLETAARVVTTHLDALAAIALDPEVSRMRRRLGQMKAAPAVALVASQLDESDEKVVVFAHHRTVLEELSLGLDRFGVAYVDGDTSPSRRDAAIDRFQTDPHCRVFLGQNIACQTGITLTAARRVVLVEPDWTATVNKQLGHRVARIGQTAERCIAQMICLAGTLDEAIVTRNFQETRMADTLGLGV